MPFKEISLQKQFFIYNYYFLKIFNNTLYYRHNLTNFAAVLLIVNQKLIASTETKQNILKIINGLEHFRNGIPIKLNMCILIYSKMTK